MSKFKSKKGLILSVGAVLAGISLTTIVASCAPTIAKKTTPTQNQKVETNKEVSTTKTTQDQPVIKDNQVNKEQIQDTKETESKELKEYKDAKEFVISNYSLYVLADDKTVDPEVKEYGLTFLSERLAILEKAKAKIDKKESLADMADELSKIKTLKEDWEKIQKENTDALKSVNPDYKEDGEVPEKENWWSTDPDPDSKADKAKGGKVQGGKTQGDEVQADQSAPADQATSPVSSPTPAPAPNPSSSADEERTKRARSVFFMLTQQEFALNKLSDLTIEKLNDKQKLKEIAQKYNEHFRTVVKKYKNIEMLANQSTTVAYLVTFFSQYKQFVNLIHQLVSQLPEKLTEIEAKLDDVLSSAKKEYTDEWDKDDAFKKINEDLVKIFYDVLKQTKQNQA